MTDFAVNDQGTIVVFTPMTDAAAEFLEKHVHIEDWQWIGRTSFAVDHRIAQTLVHNIEAEGFTVGRG